MGLEVYGLIGIKMEEKLKKVILVSNGVAKGNWSFWDKKGRKRLGKKLNMKHLLTKMQLNI